MSNQFSFNSYGYQNESLWRDPYYATIVGGTWEDGTSAAREIVNGTPVGIRPAAPAGAVFRYWTSDNPSVEFYPGITTGNATFTVPTGITGSVEIRGVYERPSTPAPEAPGIPLNAVFVPGERVRVTNPVTTLPYPPHTATDLPAATFRNRVGTVRVETTVGNRTFVLVDFPANAQELVDGVLVPAREASQLWFEVNNVRFDSNSLPPHQATLFNAEWVLNQDEVNAGVRRTGPRRIPEGRRVYIRPSIPSGNEFILWASRNGINITEDLPNRPGVYYFTMPNAKTDIVAAFSPTSGTTTPPPGEGSGGAGGTVRIGDRVRVNNNVATWATGQAMPNWVHGRTYPVIELRTRNGVNEVLLGEILSWIRASDITLV